MLRMLRLRPSSPPHSGWAGAGGGLHLWWATGKTRQVPTVEGPVPTHVIHTSRLSPGPGSEAALGPDPLGLPENSREPWGQMMFKVFRWIEIAMNATKMFQYLEYSSRSKSVPINQSANQVISVLPSSFHRQNRQT